MNHERESTTVSSVAYAIEIAIMYRRLRSDASSMSASMSASVSGNARDTV